MHKLQMYENLKDMIESEVKEIEKQGGLNTQSVDQLFKLMTIIKDADKCIEREKGESGMSGGSYGNSNRQSRASYGGSYGSYDSYDGNSGARRGRDGDGDGRYSEGRYSRGRSYESSYRYSRDGEKQKMIQKLEMLMDEPMGEEERMAIIDCIEKIK